MNPSGIKNSIISFTLIVSTVLAPLSFMPKKAEAQLPPGASGYVKGLGPAIAALPQCRRMINRAIKGLFNGIGDLFTTDEGKVKKNIEDTFKEDFKKQAEVIYNDDGTVTTLTKVVDKSLSINDKIPVYDAETMKRLDKMGKDLKVLTQKTEAGMDNALCIQSIGRLISKMLIQKLTLSMVDWINTGFHGAPTFLQNPGKFFGDIARNEILRFHIDLNDPVLFPFGKEFLRKLIIAFNQRFQDNARYSLNELIKNTTPQFSDIEFREDFSKGGWNAWLALTQVPANNPIGFTLIANNEIQRRLEGTVQSAAEKVHEVLENSGGFLGDERCVDPEGVTKQQDDAASREIPPRILCKEWQYVTPGRMIADAVGLTMEHEISSYMNVEDLNDAVAAILDAGLAKFTSTIMEKGLVALDKEGADGSLTFTKSDNKAYRSQTEKDFSPTHLTSSWLAANPNFDIRTDLTQELIDTQRIYSNKLKFMNKELMSTTDSKNYSLNGGGGVSNPNDGIWSTNDGGQNGSWSTNDGGGGIWTSSTGTGKGGTGIAFWQTDLFGGVWTSTEGSGTWFRLTGQNGIPGSSGTWDSNGGTLNPPGGSRQTSNAYGLLPVIYQLDYCIPGPHPGWEEDSGNTLAEVLDKIIPETQASLEDRNNDAITGVAKGFAPLAAGAIGAALAGTATSAGLIGISFGAAAGPIGILIGAAIGTILGAILGGTSTDEKLRMYYSSIIYALTGYLPDYKDNNDDRTGNIMSKSGMSHVLNEILNRYIMIMGKTYFSGPEILPTVAKEAAAAFNQARGYNQMITNNEEKIALLETTINLLGEIKTAVDGINGTLQAGGVEYENELKLQINAFGIIAGNMVNEDDTKGIDDLITEIINKKNYLLNSVLQGDYGCEASLAKPQKKFPSAGAAGIPSYDWDNFDATSVKRMEYPYPILYEYSGSSILGPGFLSFVFFSAFLDGTINGIPNESLVRGPERLIIWDLIPDWEDADNRYNKCRAVGKRSNTNNRDIGGITCDELSGIFESIIGIY